MEELRCRICLQECATTMHSMFTKHHELSPHEMLLKLKIQIVVTTGQSSLCNQCLSELENCVKFFEKCENSNMIFSTKLPQYKSLDQQSEVIDVPLVTKPSDETEENVSDDDESPDLETIGLRYQTRSPCVECGSKRKCRHQSPIVYTCDICNKNFTKKFNYTIHVKRHLGIREWPCPDCGTPQLTSWHAKHHCASKSRFFCPAPDCTRSYTTEHNLTIHMRRHTGEKPHKCTDCGKRFISKTILSAHTRVHAGVKRYLCSICGAQFKNNKLIAHLKTHTTKAKLRKRQPPQTKITRSQQSGAFACAHCSMRYSHKQSLNRHLRKQHNSQEQEDSDQEQS